MIYALSPPVRRIVALGILVLLLMLGTSLIASLAAAVSGAVEELEDRRSQTARLVALAQSPPTHTGIEVSEDLLFRSPTPAAAQADFTGRVAQAAANAQLTIKAGAASTPATNGNSILSLPLVGEGSEQAVLSFVSQLEQGRPVVRFSSWTIKSSEDPAVLRFEAVAIAAWGGPR